MSSRLLTAFALAATLGIAGTATQVDVEAATVPIATGTPVMQSPSAAGAERVALALNQAGRGDGTARRLAPVRPPSAAAANATATALDEDASGESLSNGQIAMAAALMALIVIVRRRNATRAL